MAMVCRLTAYDCHMDMFCTRWTSTTLMLPESDFMNAATASCFSGPSGTLNSSTASGSLRGDQLAGGLSASLAPSPPPSELWNFLRSSCEAIAVHPSIGNQPESEEMPSTPTTGGRSCSSKTTLPKAQPSGRCLET